MAFTKVLGPGIHTLSNITSHNIHSSGIVTAVSFVGDGSSLTGIANTDAIVGTSITMGTANFTGNVTIGGTLTYEDVTNVDSVGIITARDGINVTGGHIGVGVTPETWTHNLRAVQIGRQGCITGQTSANIVEISANAYHNSGWKYIENDTATSYYQYQGNHVFSSAASGTADDPITFSEKLRIKSDGNVGIGTDDPSVILDIRETKTAGSTKVRVYNTDNSNTTTQTAEVGLSPDSRGLAGAGIKAFKENADFSTNAGRDISLALNVVRNNSQSEALRIDSNGNLGINTDNPGVQAWRSGKILDIHGGAGNVTGELHIGANRGDGAQSVGSINFYDNTQDSTHRHVALIESDKGGTTTNKRGGQLVFYTKPDNVASPEERLRITSDGNLGINRTDPNQRLNVSGNIEVNAYDNTGGSGGYNTSSGLIIGNLYDAGKSYSGSDDRTACIWQERGLDLDFATNDTLRMKLTYDGNVGIGTESILGRLNVFNGSPIAISAGTGVSLMGIVVEEHDYSEFSVRAHGNNTYRTLVVEFERGGGTCPSIYVAYAGGAGYTPSHVNSGTAHIQFYCSNGNTLSSGTAQAAGYSGRTVTWSHSNGTSDVKLNIASVSNSSDAVYKFQCGYPRGYITAINVYQE